MADCLTLGELLWSVETEKPYQGEHVKKPINSETLIKLLNGTKPSKEFNDTYYDIDSSFPLLSRGCRLRRRTFFLPHYHDEWCLKFRTFKAKSKICGKENILSFFQQCEKFKDCEYLETIASLHVMHFGVCRYFLDLDCTTRIDVCGSDREPMMTYAYCSLPKMLFTWNPMPSKIQAMLLVLNPSVFEIAFATFIPNDTLAHMFDTSHPLFDPCEKVLELKSSQKYRESFFHSSSSSSSEEE